jgi:hypothetical protein
MRTTTRAALTIVVLAASLAGCGGSGGSTSDSSADGAASSEPTATVTVTETVTATPSAEASETPSEEATPSAQEPNVGDRALKIGQWREGTQVRTRVVEFFQPANAPKPSYLQGDDDGDGAVARIEMCTREGAKPTKGDIYGLFMAYDNSGGQYTQSSSTWGEWPPLPQLPDTVSIAPGKCLSGWVLISAPKATKLVTFDMSDGEGGSIAEWKVS